MPSVRKITQEQEIEMMGRHFLGESQCSVAKHYGVNQSLISLLKTRKYQTTEMVKKASQAASLYFQKLANQRLPGVIARNPFDESRSDHGMPVPAVEVMRTCSANGPLIVQNRMQVPKIGVESFQGGGIQDAIIAFYHARMTKESTSMLHGTAPGPCASSQIAVNSIVTVGKQAEFQRADLEPSLQSRVRQRAATSTHADEILDKLKKFDLISIGSCSYMHSINRLKEAGFDSEDVALLICDDEQWKSKYEWLDTFFESIPSCLHNCIPVAKTIIKQERRITELRHLYEMYESLPQLPWPIKQHIHSCIDASQNENTEDNNLEHGNDAIGESGVPSSSGQISGSNHSGSRAAAENQENSRESVSEGQRLSANESGPNTQDAVQWLITLKDNPSAGQDDPRDQVDHQHALDVETLRANYKTVHKLVAQFYTNTVGISGTIRPKQAIDILVDGHTALNNLHGAAEVVFVDLGCSCGHMLWAAAMSGLFKDIRGVELPANRQNIERVTQDFKSRATTHPKLGKYTEQYENVKFHWIDCGLSGNTDIFALLEGSSPLPAMLYWFCPGWSQKDIETCARMISRSSSVLCVVCLLRCKGFDAKRLLCELNHSQMQKRFYMHFKREGVPMSGTGTHTAFCFLRRREFEFELPTPAEPIRGQKVQVIFEDPLSWFDGEVVRFDRESSTGTIGFEDQTEENFKLGDSDVVFLPTADNQWLPVERNDAQSVRAADRKFCTCCSETLKNEDSLSCSRCRVTAYHLKCLQVNGPAPAFFLCPFCRAELADIGRSQTPQLKCSNEHDKMCFGCASPTFNKADRCERCNALYGHCCSSRTSDTPLAFICPACVGISAHDCALEYCFDRNSKTLSSILQNTDQGLQDKRGQKAKNDEFMDEYALALCSLQDNCHWDLFERHLPYGISLLRHQIREQKDPSMGPFHILNVLGMENVSELDLDLFNQASEQYALHARKNAKSKQSGKKPVSQTRTVSTGLDSTTSKGRKVTYVTADMRRSPWWQLSKVQLLELAQRNTLFIYSRPLIQLDGDPYYEALKKMCTIIEFKEETSDAEVAKCIIGDSPDVVLDAGGPTYGSFTGVMALLPRHILRGAHLGFPGTQPGGHIDFSIVDQFVMTPGCAQAEGADEAFMFLSCYQPNDSWQCSVSIDPVVPVPQTRRSDWNLPEEAFVFGYFCRLGRISKRLIETFAKILRQTPNGVLWIRNTPQIAVLRVKKFLLANGIEKKRVITACDVPNEEHRERLKHADLCLDSDIYGGHTTASDSLLSGVPYLALVGIWWHGRVSYSLINNMMDNIGSDFLCYDLKTFQEKAIHFGTNGVQALKRFREQLGEQRDSKLGICDGGKWIREFEMGLDEFIRQKKDGTRLKDVFLGKVINDHTTKRERTVLLHAQGEENGTDVGGPGMSESPKHVAKVRIRQEEPGYSSSYGITTNMNTAGSKRVSDAPDKEVAFKRSKLATSSNHHPAFACHIQQSSASFPPASHSAAPAPGSTRCDGECGEILERRATKSKSEKHRLKWLFDLAKQDPDKAREQAYKYLRETMPADREIARYTRGDGTEMWAIQLPCTKPRIPSESGKSTVRETEFPLLYVTKKVGSRGSDLCAGQSFEAGMYMTGYDGILLDSQMVQDKTHAISVSYGARQAIDSGGVPDWKLVEHCSLGAKSNHSYNRSNVKYIRKDWISPISNHGTSIYVQAKTQGAPHDILLGFYTSGAAERDHGIQRRPLPEGKSSIPDEAYRNYRVSSPVTEAMEVLRKDAGFDLIKICGSGSQGVVVEVKHPGHPRTFVVKIGKKRFSESERLSVLVEAALMYHASRKTDSSIGTFSSQLKSDIGWGHASVAILRASGERVAAVAMERADSDAFEICRKFCDRFTTGGIQELLPDLQSVLHGMIRAASWMHKCSYAHGDLKASNILLKRLDRAPAEHVAFCVVQGVTYQIVFGDWGHARWSGRTKDSYHLFAQEGGKPHWSSFCLEDDGKTTISSLNLRELITIFGLRLQNPCKFPHPGAGTVTIQAPDVLRKFGDGQGLAQRLFDQAGDMWALGVISIGVFAPPQYKPAHNKDVFIRDREWAKQLRDASRSAARLKKVFRQPTASRGLHAVQMLDPVADCGSWIAGYVRKYYAQDMWPILSSCMSGQQKSDWLSLLDLQEGLLSYSSADRLTAEQALEHACFNGIMKCT